VKKVLTIIKRTYYTTTSRKPRLGNPRRSLTTARTMTVVVEYAISILYSVNEEKKLMIPSTYSTVTMPPAASDVNRYFSPLDAASRML
jgi:uncharacterized protein YutE (UPF0331/DUF86 family)